MRKKCKLDRFYVADQVSVENWGRLGRIAFQIGAHDVVNVHTQLLLVYFHRELASLYTVIRVGSFI